MDAADAVRDEASTQHARSNVYRDTESLLRDMGWTKGHERSRGGKLSLTGAIRASVSSGAISPEQPHIVRIARIRRHLREIARTSSLLAWNDSPDRSFADVVNLLRVAAERFPGD